MLSNGSSSLSPIIIPASPMKANMLHSQLKFLSNTQWKWLQTGNRSSILILPYIRLRAALKGMENRHGPRLRSLSWSDEDERSPGSPQWVLAEKGRIGDITVRRQIGAKTVIWKLFRNERYIRGRPWPANGISRIEILDQGDLISKRLHLLSMQRFPPNARKTLRSFSCLLEVAGFRRCFAKHAEEAAS